MADASVHTADASAAFEPKRGAVSGLPTDPGPGADRAAACRRGVAVVAAGLVALTVVLVYVRAGQPSDLAQTQPGPQAGQADGVKVLPLPGQRLGAQAGGFRSGDIVTAVGDVPLSRWPRLHARPGDDLVYTVRRAGQPLHVAVHLRRYPILGVLAASWPTLLLIAAVLSVAVYVFVRRPDDRAARALLLIATLTTCASTYWVFGWQVLDSGGAPGWWALLVAGVAYALLWGSILHFVAVFPEPRRFVQRSGAISALYAAPLALHGFFLAVTLPGSDNALQRARLIASTAVVSEYAVPLVVVVSFVPVFRSSLDAATRQRLRWVLGSFVLATVLWMALWKLPNSTIGRPLLSRPLHSLVFLPCPLALGAAILRLGLFDINIIVRRSLVYGALTACLFGVYAGTVGLVGRLVASSNRAGLAATATVVLLFAPLRDRLQRGVSRLVYGHRDDPTTTLARLGHQLEITPAPQDLLPGVAKTLAEALRLPYVAIDVVGPGGLEPAASFGSLGGKPIRLPLLYGQESIGQLTVSERTPGEPFGPADRRALGALAPQVGVAAHAVSLTLDLQRSRERLVTAREEERRRLRRDLHDGLAPTLASLALQLGVARRLVHSQAMAADSLLDRLSEEARAATEEVRRIVEDLRPPSLDQLGLVAALRHQASGFDTRIGGDGVSVAVEAEGDFDALPAAVEVAAYRIAVEAMNNAVRHGQARWCIVRIRADVALDLEVTDDGCGLPAVRRSGVGLASMRERAAELGGSCTIEAGSAGGTSVRARIPLTSA